MALKYIDQIENLFETVHLCICEKLMIKHDPYDKVPFASSDIFWNNWCNDYIFQV